MILKLKETICEILKRLGLIADYVVEYGTAGIWTYRKWASGIAECWMVEGPTTWNLVQSYGYTYYGAITRTFPTGLFNSRPSLTGSVAGGGGIIRVSFNETSSTGFNVYLDSPVRLDSIANAYLFVHAIGAWKSIVGG